MLRVIKDDRSVASVYLSDKHAPNHNTKLPWVLRIEPFRSVEAFATQKDAKKKAAELFGVRVVFLKVE
jgi:hypothetical protein